MIPLLRIALVLLGMLFLGCAHRDLPPVRSVTVMDVSSGKPVEGVPLVYRYVQKPYWIVGRVVESRPYISDSNGVAMVPSRADIDTSSSSVWLLDWDRTYGSSNHPRPVSNLYVKRK